MKIHKVEQRTLEWFRARAGLITASEMPKLVTPATGELRLSRDKKSFSQAVDTYLLNLAAESFHYQMNETVERLETKFPSSAAMMFGIETETEARMAYAFERDLHEHDLKVGEVGMCSDDAERIACSPDGLIHALDDSTMFEDFDPHGGVEIKCVQANTQLRRLLDGGLPDDYKAQVHTSLYVTKLPWWDFWSYCPNLPPLLVRVFPDEYTEAVGKSMERLADELDALKARLAKVGVDYSKVAAA